MISIIHLHFMSALVQPQLDSYSNQASPKWGSVYNYMSNTLNHSSQETRLLYFDQLQNFASLANEVSR